MPVDVTLLPPNASAYELASEAASATRWEALDIGAIPRAKDPATCPEQLLPFLAYEHSVDIWDDAWPLEKKRAVIASAARDHRLKGTEAGLRRYLGYADAELVQVVTAPQGFYAAPDLTAAQWDSWLAHMPRLRIALADGEGEWSAPVGLFADQAAADVDHEWLNEGPALYGRRAYLRKTAAGPDLPLQFASVSAARDVRDGVVLERVVVPGVDANGTVADHGAAGDAFAGAEGRAPQFYSFALDRQYVHVESALALDSVPIGLEPLDTRYFRETDTGEAGARLFVGDAGADANFVGVNDGGELLADVLYLHDPDVAAPVVDGIGFADHARVGAAPFTAQLLVDASHTVPELRVIMAGEGFVGEVAAPDNDQAHLEFAYQALAASKALRDQLLVSFKVLRERSVHDHTPLDGSARLGSYVPNFI